MKNANILFNRKLLIKNRNHASMAWDELNFLKIAASERLADRLEDLQRTFPLGLDLGAHAGEISCATLHNKKIEKCFRSDLAEKFHPHLVCDEEFLPFAPQSFDIILSGLSLHWVNDLPGTLIQCHRILKPEGLFLAVLPGTQTLWELRECFMLAEEKIYGGISPRIIPFPDIRDAASLLQRANFALPVADSEILTISYPDFYTILQDLRMGGEKNIMHERSSNPLSKRFLQLVAEIYSEKFTDVEGRLTVTVELVTLTGLANHGGQTGSGIAA